MKPPVHPGSSPPTKSSGNIANEPAVGLGALQVPRKPDDPVWKSITDSWGCHTVALPQNPCCSIADCLASLRQQGIPFFMKGGAAWDLYQQVVLPSPSQARDELHDVDIGITAPSVEYLVGILTCFNLHHTVAIRPSNGHSTPTLIKTHHPDATTYKVCLLYEGPHIIGCSLTLPPTYPDGLSLDVSLMWPGKSGVDYVHTDLAVHITQKTTRFVTLHGYTMADVIEARQTKRMIETHQHVVGLHWRFCKWASRGYHYDEDTWAHAQESFKQAYLDPRSTMTNHMPRRFDGMSPQEQERECSVMLTMCQRLNLAVPRWVGERFPSIRPWPYLPIDGETGAAKPASNTPLPPPLPVPTTPHPTPSPPSPGPACPPIPAPVPRTPPISIDTQIERLKEDIQALNTRFTAVSKQITTHGLSSENIIQAKNEIQIQLTTLPTQLDSLTSSVSPPITTSPDNPPSAKRSTQPTHAHQAQGLIKNCRTKIEEVKRKLTSLSDRVDNTLQSLEARPPIPPTPSISVSDGLQKVTGLLSECQANDGLLTSTSNKWSKEKIEIKKKITAIQCQIQDLIKHCQPNLPDALSQDLHTVTQEWTSWKTRFAQSQTASTKRTQATAMSPPPLSTEPDLPPPAPYQGITETIMALRQQASNRPNGQKKQPAIDQVTDKELVTLIRQFSHNKWVQPKKTSGQQKTDLVTAKEVATLIKHFSDNRVNPEPTSTRQKIECLAYLLDPRTELGQWLLKPSHHYQVSMLGMMSGIYEKIATDQTIQTISEKDRDTLSRIQNELTNKMLTCQLPAEPVMVILKGHRTLGHTVTTSDQEQLIKTLDARTIIQAHDDLFPTQAAYHQWINQQLSTINQIEAVPVWDAEWARCIIETINSNPGNPTHQHLYQFVENAIKEKPNSLDWITPIHWDIVRALRLLRTVWTTYPNQWDLAMQPLPTEKVASIQTGLQTEFGYLLIKNRTKNYNQLEPVIKHFFSVLLGFTQPLDPDILYILREVLNTHERATPQLTSQIQQHIQQGKITQPLLQCLLIFQPFQHTLWYSPEVNPLCDADHPNDRIPNWIKKSWDEPINPLIPTFLATDNPVMAKQDAIMGFMITYLTINPQSPPHPQLKTIIQSLDDNQKSQLLSQLPIPSIVKYWEQLFSDKEQYRTWMQGNINRPTVPPVCHKVANV